MKWERLHPGKLQLRLDEIFCSCERRFSRWNACAEFLPNDCGAWITFRRNGFKSFKAAQRWAEEKIPLLQRLAAEEKGGGE